MHIALDDIDRRQHDQVARPCASPGRYGYPQATRDQSRDDMTPDKPGAADHENVGVLHVERIYGSSVAPAASVTTAVPYCLLLSD